MSPSGANKQKGWVRTWSEVNRVVSQDPMGALPEWHVLENGLAAEDLPDDDAWAAADAGMALWDSWGITPSGSSPDAQWMAKCRHWTARRMPKKSGWDAAFYATIPEPCREVFALSAQSENHRIVAIDTNGAYSFAVANIPVPNPARLRFVTGEAALQAWENPAIQGAFRVLITKREDTPAWWDKFHPLVHRVGRATRPILWPDDTVETFVHKCEKDAWLACVDMTPIDAVVAEGTQHPLAATARTLWAQRQSAGNATDKACAKWLLSRLHTASAPSRTKYVTPSQKEEWYQKLGCEPLTTDDAIAYVDHPECLWSSAATVSAWARGSWLLMMTAFMRVCPTAIPAYTNVDSLHMIIPRDCSAETLQRLAALGLLGASWGKWRLQAEGSKGVWLGLGKYWILDDAGVLVLCQNLGNKKPWSTSRRWYRPLPVAHAAAKHEVTRISQTIWQTLSSASDLEVTVTGLTCYRRRSIAVARCDTAWHAAITGDMLKTRGLKKRIWYRLRELCYSR
jgi:hypothetical protein